MSSGQDAPKTIPSPAAGAPPSAGRLPLLYLAAVGGAIFFAEAAIMHLALPRLELPDPVLAVVDGLLLLLLLFPVLHFFIYRPLLRQFRGRLELLEEKSAILDRLSDSEARYRALFENNHAAILLIDPAGGEIIDANPSACRFYGYAPEEIRRRRISDINILSPAEIAAAMERAAALRQRHFDFRHRLADGTVRDVEVFSGPIRVGERQLLYSIVHDVTEARQAAEALRRSEERLGSIYRLTGAGIATLSAEGRILQANPAFCAFLGYPEEELLRLGVEDVTAREDIPVTRRFFREAIEGKTRGFQYEKRFRRRDGSLVWGQVSTSWVHDEEATSYAIGLVQDITARKEAERELRTAHRTLEALFAAAPLAIVAMDLERRVTDWNPAAERLFGWQREELLGRPYPLVPEEKIDQFEKHRRETLRGLSIVGRETVRLRRDGSRVEVSLSTSPVYHGEKIDGVMVIFEEITARKRMEEELRLAKESAERANRTKSDFLANMSHEIRTPMNGVLGMTEIVLGTDLTADQRDFLQMAQESARSLLALLNDILDFSRLEAGMLTLGRTEFDLREVLQGTLKTFTVLAHQKGVRLSSHIPPEVPAAVVGDPARLRQVLYNLIANALKFTEGGEVSLAVAREEKGLQEVRLRFSVRDTGIGIPLDQQERIFENFVQVDGSLTRRHGGSGLGLTISRNIVRLMGGRLWVESRPGEGSTFHFTAVLSPAERDEQGRSDSPYPVLLVDDNPTHLQILEEAVAALGFPSVSAGSGPQALGLLRQGGRDGRPFAAVLTDFIMPGMDGMELAEAIHADHSFPSPLLVLLTSGAGVHDAWRGAGFAACLQKPVPPAPLAAVLERGRSEFNPSPPLPPTTLPPPPRSADGLRILLVEDERINQKLAGMILESRGHRVTVADHGAEALERLTEERYDIVLMDVQMPVMDGMEATRRIRSETQGRFDPAVPIIAMTAHALPEDREACLAAGMSGYLTKPLDLQKFMALVEEFSPRRGTAAEEPSPVVDAARVLDLLGGDREGCREIWKVFCSDAPRQLAALSELVEEGGVPLARGAHRLKGAAAAAGAVKVQRIAAELEVAAQGGGSHDSRRLMAELREETGRALDRLEELITGGKKGEER